MIYAVLGTSQMDGAILVIAATDGTMPQTREHLLLARQIGIQHVVVFINKADLVDNDMIELVELEARELLEEYGFNGNSTAVIAGSALLAMKGENDSIGKASILKLLEAVDKTIPTPKRDFSGPFLMPVETSLSVPGRGTVVVGTVLQGTMKKGQSVELLGYGNEIKSSTADIHIFHKSVQQCNAGDNIGALLRNVKSELVKRGMFLCQPGSLQQFDTFEAQIYVLTKAEGGRTKPILDQYVQVCLFWYLNSCDCFNSKLLYIMMSI